MNVFFRGVRTKNVFQFFEIAPHCNLLYRITQAAQGLEQGLCRLLPYTEWPVYPVDHLVLPDYHHCTELRLVYGNRYRYRSSQPQASKPLSWRIWERKRLKRLSARTSAPFEHKTFGFMETIIHRFRILKILSEATVTGRFSFRSTVRLSSPSDSHFASYPPKEGLFPERQAWIA